MNALTSAKMRTSASIVNWYTMVHWHSNVQSNLISSNLFCTTPPTSHANMLQTSCEFPPVFKCSKHCRFASLAGLGAKSLLRTARWESIESMHGTFGKFVTCAHIAIWCIQSCMCVNVCVFVSYTDQYTWLIGSFMNCDMIQTRDPYSCLARYHSEACQCFPVLEQHQGTVEQKPSVVLVAQSPWLSSHQKHPTPSVKLPGNLWNRGWQLYTAVNIVWSLICLNQSGSNLIQSLDYANWSHRVWTFKLTRYFLGFTSFAWSTACVGNDTGFAGNTKAQRTTWRKNGSTKAHRSGPNWVAA